MTTVFVANGMSFGAWAGSIPRLRDNAGLDEASLGVVLLCVSLGAVAAMPMAGRYAASLGLVRCCWIGALAIALVMPLPALAPGRTTLLCAAVAIGFAMGWLDVCMNAQAAAIERGWGAPLMSSMHAGWSLGQLLGAAAGGLLAAAGVGLAASVAVEAGLVAALGLAGLAVREAGTAPEKVRFAFPNRAMLGLCLVVAASFSVEAAVADWSGVFLRVELGASEAAATTSIAVFAGTMVACRVVGDWIVRRAGPRRTVVLGGALAAAGLGLVVVAPGLAVASIGFALVGMGVANVVPVVFSAAGRGGAAGLAMAATAGYGAMMAAPPVIGLVSHEFGLRAGIVLIAVGAVVMAVLGRRAL